MRRSPLLLLAAILPMAACSHAGGNASADAGSLPAKVSDGPQECRPEALDAFTGKTADEATIKKLVADSGARNARVVKPGMAVTMDFRQDRVTVQVDAQNRIERASCG
ncbi:I78 family peptidase inhibitor [Stenotrophomonas sp. C1657]|uniref:I78 family peptidase inhibitor n=1 Tax=Stenotrophomonas sp. C1657 TaxID=3077844 RepID=UPI00293CF9F5|nr:I78 family peptidase inhibitor [Stenotrophomonas sp. C1657]MDV3513878.1 I78 family peptidase inhibitor [Stenotrophomonas sp. C1657]